MSIILNLTQHQATPDQRDKSVVEPENKEAIKRHLDFDDAPSAKEISVRARTLAELATTELDARGVAESHRFAMVGGAPFFMADLELALRERGITPLYAFSKRASHDVMKEDGTVEKKVIFRHQGFIEGRAHLRDLYRDQQIEAQPLATDQHRPSAESIENERDAARAAWRAEAEADMREHDPSSVLASSEAEREASEGRADSR